MNVTTAILQIRDILDEPTPQFWTDAQLQRWINEGCQDFARRTRTLRQQTTVPVVANTQNYTAPAILLSIYRIEFQPTSTGQVFIYPLEFMGYNEMDQAWGVYQTFPAAWPQGYTLWGNPPTLTIRLFPVPNQAGVLNVFGYRQSVDTVVVGDTVDVLQAYEGAIVEYAIYKAQRKDKDKDSAMAKARYEEYVLAATNDTGWFTDQPNQMTTGQSQWPPWALSGSDW